jgi:calpain-15
MIKRLFVTQKANKRNVYCVWLCYEGEWQQVLVDDFFPCNKKTKQPVYSSSTTDLWVLVLEKAYAKVYGNYEKIENAWSGDALRDLTGAYAKEYRKKNETPAEGDRLFGIV